jgi:hypothetical protein
LHLVFACRPGRPFAHKATTIHPNIIPPSKTITPSTAILIHCSCSPIFVTMSAENQPLLAVDRAIAVVNEIEPSKRGTLTLALSALSQLPHLLDMLVSELLQQRLALFSDIDPKNPILDPAAPRPLDEEQLAELEEIVVQFSQPPAQASGRPLQPFDPDMSEEVIGNIKKCMLFFLYCLRLAVVIGIVGGAWVNTRALGGASVFTAKGQFAAVGAGAIAGLSQPHLDDAFVEFEKWLVGSAIFEGEVPELVEHIRMLVAALVNATSVFAVLQLAEKIEEDHPGHSNHFLFGGYALAFFAAGGVVAGSELVVGKKLVLQKRDGTLPCANETGALRGLSQLIIRRFTDKEIWLKRCIPYFIQWYGYWEYYEGMLGGAGTDCGKRAAVWGSLAIFFSGFYTVNHWIAKTGKQPAASAVAAV